MNSTLMKAILSMDSYNRGYDPKISFGTDKNYSPDSPEIKIGKAEIYRANGDAAAQNISFYAIAYEYGGEKIISYRGTDSALDIATGWLLGGGDTTAPQGDMAIKFYKDVVSELYGSVTMSNLINSPISLTGHSLGGGLAGYVSSLYHKDAIIFDSMGYQAAAKNEYDFASLPPTNAAYNSQAVPRINFVYNGLSPWPINGGGVEAMNIEGEILHASWFRQSPSRSLSMGSDVDLDWFEPVEKHSMSTMVLRVYADGLSNSDWNQSAQYFWRNLYDDAFAQSIGFDGDNFEGRDIDDKDYSSVLRQALAYSALDDGALLFGDTGIVSFFDDANNLGLALTGANVSSLITTRAPDVSKLMVQFAGQLALSQVEKKNYSDVVHGVLSFTNETNALGINLNDDRWHPALSFIEQPVAQTATLMTLREDILSKLLTTAGFSTAFLTETAKLWMGAGLGSIEHVIVPGKTTGTVTIDGVDGFGTAPSLYIGLQTADDVSITASLNQAMIMTGNGNDVVSVNSVDIYNAQIDGGLGNDTFSYKVASYSEDVSIDMSGSLVLVQGDVSEYYIKNFEIFRFRDDGDFSLKMRSPSAITIDAGTHLGINLNGSWYVTGPSADVDYSGVQSGMRFVLHAFSPQDTTPPIGTAKLKSGTVTDTLINVEGVFGTNYGDDYNISAVNIGASIASTRIYSGTGNDTVMGPVSDYFYTGGNDILTPHENVVCQNVNTRENGSVVWLPYGVEQGDVTLTRVNLKNTGGGTFSYDVLVSVAGHGTITLKNFRAVKNGSENEIVFSGFWGVKSHTNWAYKLIDDYDFQITSTIWNRYYHGTNSDDVIVIDTPYYVEAYGHSGNDRITGGLHGDYIDGGFDDDILYGEGGDDTLVGGHGNDRIYGGSGNDEIKGNVGNDLLSGGDGDDLYWAGSGIDEIQDSSGRDTLYMEHLSYQDLVISIVGADLRIVENIGNSEILIRNNSIENIVFKENVSLSLSDFQSWEVVTENHPYEGSSGNNIIFGGSSNDIIRGNAGNDTIYAGNGSDVIEGGGGNDLLYGSDGDDVINGGSGNDRMYGGKGNDTYYVDSMQDKTPEWMEDDEGLDTVVTTLVSYGHDSEGTILTGLFAIEASGGSYDDDGSFVHGNDNINILSGFGLVEIHAGKGNDFIGVQVSGSSTVSGGDGVDVASFGEYGTTYADYSITTNSEFYFVKNISRTSQPVARISKDVEVLQFNDGIYRNGVFSSGNVDTYSYDVIAGTSSDDIFNMSAWDGISDQISGGLGNDTYIVDDTTIDIIIEGVNAGVDSVISRNTYTLQSNVENLSLIGSAAANATGNNLDNILAGNDYKNILTGLGGNDTYHVNNTSDVVVEAASAGIDHIKSSVTYTISANVENLTLVGTESINGTGNALDNIMIGNDLSNILNGGSGNDVIDGLGGDDSLIGGAGTDQLSGGAGNDTYNISANSGLDTITDTSGSEKIVFGSGISQTNTTYARSSNDLVISVSGTQVARIVGHFAGTGAVETLQFSNGTTVNLTTLTFPINGTSGNNTLTGTAAADTINGLAGNDMLYGAAGNDILNGGDGNDTLYGDAGSDTLRGEAGNDIYVFDGGQDKIYETSGTDILRLGASRTADALVFSDVGTVDTKMTFSSGNDITIYGQRGTNANLKVETVQFADGFSASLSGYKSWVWGSTAAQTTNGTTAANTILGRGGNDTINGLAGNDNLHGGSGNDTVKGGDGNDLVHGGIGNDMVYGDAGNDIIYGDDGLDNLYGGTGADTFMFLKETAFKNIDVINDFSKTQNDKINIKDLLQGYDPLTKAITDFVQITTSGTNSILKVDADGGANGFVQIATIKGVTGLTDEAALVASGNLIAT